MVTVLNGFIFRYLQNGKYVLKNIYYSSLQKMTQLPAKRMKIWNTFYWILIFLFFLLQISTNIAILKFVSKTWRNNLQKFERKVCTALLQSFNIVRRTSKKIRGLRAFSRMARQCIKKEERWKKKNTQGWVSLRFDF